MTGNEMNESEKHRAGFAGIVLLLRQLAQQLMEHGNATEARGIVDGIEAVQAKTSGNLDDGESRFLEEILCELRMAVVQGPPGAAEEDAGEEAAAAKGETAAEETERPPEPAEE